MLAFTCAPDAQSAGNDAGSSVAVGDSHGETTSKIHGAPTTWASTLGRVGSAEPSVTALPLDDTAEHDPRALTASPQAALVRSHLGDTRVATHWAHSTCTTSPLGVCAPLAIPRSAAKRIFRIPPVGREARIYTQKRPASMRRHAFAAAFLGLAGVSARIDPNGRGWVDDGGATLCAWVSDRFVAGPDCATGCAYRDGALLCDVTACGAAWRGTIDGVAAVCDVSAGHASPAVSSRAAYLWDTEHAEAVQDTIGAEPVDGIGWRNPVAFTFELAAPSDRQRLRLRPKAIAATVLLPGAPAPPPVSQMVDEAWCGFSSGLVSAAAVWFAPGETVPPEFAAFEETHPLALAAGVAGVTDLWFHTSTGGFAVPMSYGWNGTNSLPPGTTLHVCIVPDISTPSPVSVPGFPRAFESQRWVYADAGRSSGVRAVVVNRKRYFYSL